MENRLCIYLFFGAKDKCYFYISQPVVSCNFIKIVVFDKYLRDKLRLITFLVLKKMMLQFLWDTDETDSLSRRRG